MRIVKLVEHAKHGATIRLFHVTDTHLGAPDTDEGALRATVKRIADDPDARWTFGGDCGDLIRFNDRRYQPTELAPRYRQATDIRLASLEHAEEIFKPIAGQCWAWADGNHERKYDEHYGGHFGVEICCNLGIESRYVGYRGFVHVTFQLTKTTRLTQLIDIQHGWQAGRSGGAFVNQAEKELSMTEADIVLRGHSHKPNRVTLVTLGVTNDCRRALRRHRTVLNGGTYRVGYRDDLAPINRNRLSEVEKDLWGETKGFRAEHLGGPVLELRLDGGNSARAGRNIGRPAYVHHSVIDNYAGEAAA